MICWNTTRPASSGSPTEPKPGNRREVSWRWTSWASWPCLVCLDLWVDVCVCWMWSTLVAQRELDQMNATTTMCLTVVVVVVVVVFVDVVGCNFWTTLAFIVSFRCFCILSCCFVDFHARAKMKCRHYSLRYDGSTHISSIYRLAAAPDFNGVGDLKILGAQNPNFRKMPDRENKPPRVTTFTPHTNKPPIDNNSSVGNVSNQHTSKPLT